MYLGSVHLEEHLGIPVAVANAVRAGFQKIDMEQDELLVKLQGGWTINNAIAYLPTDFEMPSEFQAHLDIGLPLLERQIRRLRDMIRAHSSASSTAASRRVLTRAQTAGNSKASLMDAHAFLNAGGRLSALQKQRIHQYLIDGVTVNS